MILLDTSFCIDWLREIRAGIEGPAGLKLRGLGDLPLALSVFSLCELEAGAQGSRSPDAELMKVRRFADHVNLVFPGRGFPALYGEALKRLQDTGQLIPLMDLLIGLCAKQEGLPVLTRDIAHFSRIEGLTIEAW